MVARLALIALVLAGCQAPPAPADAGRPQAPWPPAAGPLRVVIDTDTANEVDDQYALALAFGFPEKLKIEGIVAAHFGNAAGIEKSFKEAQEVLKLAGRTDACPLKRGVPPLKSAEELPSSDGIDFIIERALAATPEDPLWLVLLGPVTDAVVALRKEPRIADRMIVFWHGRSAWPTKCANFNATNDRIATRRIFELPCRFVLFDTGAQLRIPPEESERRFGPLSSLGAYLHEIRKRSPKWMSPQKGIFDLGDIAALVDPACVTWERTESPAVREDLTYDFSRRLGPIVRMPDVNRDRCFDLLEQSLRRLAGK